MIASEDFFGFQVQNLLNRNRKIFNGYLTYYLINVSNFGQMLHKYVS